MKRFLPLFILAIALSSCQDDVKFSNPGFQALKDDVLWQATDARAYVSTDGKLTIEAMTSYETLTLSTASANEGTYLLGTPNTDNGASYFSNFNEQELEYGTIAAPGPISNINLLTGGTGYVSGDNVGTTGGSGTGLILSIVANASGVVTGITLTSRGAGYIAGDVITVVGGNNNCKFRVINVQTSSGEIVIEEFDNLSMTVTGTFKFNAAKSNGATFGGPYLNFQHGVFHKIRIYPSI
ncbi:DUF6252 family protein [Flavobacterium wongokense]|uniref:DUF6252 family protein n=1 Tax=Flavobacterium wongokense TaxID=2910674 RepID=UPI001F27CA3F|nr:DUF6252 family protein [Flavobacterium sp. WG47]MCF6131135.1 DUF6252 family protein [Flavobacterium sp. WG47]